MSNLAAWLSPSSIFRRRFSPEAVRVLPRGSSTAPARGAWHRIEIPRPSRHAPRLNIYQSFYLCLRLGMRANPCRSGNGRGLLVPETLFAMLPRARHEAMSGARRVRRGSARALRLRAVRARGPASARIRASVHKPNGRSPVLPQWASGIHSWVPVAAEVHGRRGSPSRVAVGHRRRRRVAPFTGRPAVLPVGARRQCRVAAQMSAAGTRAGGARNECSAAARSKAPSPASHR